jgi:hypothetical protein
MAAHVAAILLHILYLWPRYRRVVGRKLYRKKEQMKEC